MPGSRELPRQWGIFSTILSYATAGQFAVYAFNHFSNDHLLEEIAFQGNSFAIHRQQALQILRWLLKLTTIAGNHFFVYT
jgi:hypothetical protein